MVLLTTVHCCAAPGHICRGFSARLIPSTRSSHPRSHVCLASSNTQTGVTTADAPPKPRKNKGSRRLKEDKPDGRTKQHKSTPPSAGHNVSASMGKDSAQPGKHGGVSEEGPNATTGADAAPAESSNIVTFDSGRHRALVLDAAYRPINVINWIKAVKMDMAGRAEVLEYYTDACVTSSVKVFPMPAVVRARKMLNVDAIVALGRVALTRKNIMTRDKMTCMYCGCTRPQKELTIDHVMPISKGGKNTWDNLATCCKVCNQRKGNLTLKQLGWKTRGPLRQPSNYELGNIVQGVGESDVVNPPAEWADYLLPYLRKFQARHGGSEPSAPAVP